jgi:Amt family ammonium transporter
MSTTLATAVACVVWPALEWITRGKPTVLGFCSGAVAGLVVITPAAGFVTANGAIIIGLLAGSVPFLACMKLKALLGYDDALDTFGVHGVGGTMGALVTGFLATPEANPNLSTNLGGLIGKSLWVEQLKAMGLTISLAVVSTVVIGYAVKAVIGFRPTREGEEEGLDQIDHGESAYHYDEAFASSHTSHSMEEPALVPAGAGRES